MNAFSNPATKAASLIFVLSWGFSSVRAADLSPLDSFVPSLMAKYKTPGVAVGVVQNGKLIYAKGFGYRNLASKLPVTTKTLFGLGSTSKAFAGVTVGLMVDDGKLDWDQPVRKYLPDFALANSTASAQATVRDLLLHRTGQARHDTMWLGTPFDRDEIFSRLGFFAFNLGFREKWQYSNLMYMAAGHLAESVSGMSWEKLVQTRIFQALKMDSSNTSVDTSQREDNFALSYKISSGRVVPRGFRKVDNMGPAASVNSSVEDMAEWLKFQISGESPTSQRVLSRVSFDETHRGQIAVPGETYDQYSEFTPTQYAFAWKVQRYRGTALRRHGGDIGGFLATVATLPELNAGVVVLQNIDNFGINNYIALRAYDLLLGKAPIDWLGRLTSRNQASVVAVANASMSEEHLFATTAEIDSFDDSLVERAPSPPLPLSSYAGNFEDEAYGPMKITVRGDKLLLAYNDWTATLIHKSGNIFECGGGFSGNATFTVNGQNRVTRVSLPLESTVAAITFEKQ